MRKSPSRHFPSIASACALWGSVSLAAAQPVPPSETRVLIRYRQAPGAVHREHLQAHGASVQRAFQLVPAFAATVPITALNAVRGLPDVEAVEPDLEVKALGEIDATWGLVRIGCGPVQSGTYPGAVGPVLGTGVRVAVVDTGIDYLHPDLAANFAGGYDFVNNDADPMDDNGHGTHVSGTIAAVRNGTGVLGAAPEADLFALKVLGSSGSGSWSGILSALDWCAANRVAVANFSLGSSSYPGTTVEAGFDNAAKAGVLLVAAAGNSGPGTDTVNYPGKFASVIAVGSTTSTDLVSSFSSTGPDVELAAPGSLIYSTTLGGGYGTLSGTSMATPHVTGVAALVVSAGIGDSNGDGFINDEVRQLLQSTAQDLGAAGRDPIYGFGLVDAEAAVAAVQGAPTQPNPVPIFYAPSNLQATVSGKTVSLSWVDNSNVETGYEVQIGRWKGRGLTWSVWNVTGTDVSTLSGSLGKGTYSFRVRGMTGNPVVYTAVSNEVTVTLR